VHLVPEGKGASAAWDGELLHLSDRAVADQLRSIEAEPSEKCEQASQTIP
jgi:hypothetical protein